MLTSEFVRLIPAGATHCLVEERVHRGSPVWAVVAVVPDGAAIPLNGFSDKEIADRTAEEVNDFLAR